MSYPNVKVEALEANLEQAFKKYIWQAQNNTDVKNYYAPWEDFKEAILDIVNSEHARPNTFRQLILRLKLLTFNNFNGSYDNAVRFDVGFIYEVLYEIASQSKTPSVMEKIIDFCVELREKADIADLYTRRLYSEYYGIMETRVYKAVAGSGNLNPHVASKMLRNTTFSFYEYFIQNHMQTFANCPHLYGYVFGMMYEKYSETWPCMEVIYSFYNNLSYEDDYEIVSSVISASQATDINGLIIGAMARFAPKHALKTLSLHTESVVRFALAFNQALDIRILVNLAQDAVPSVKWRAIQTLKEIEKSDMADEWRKKDAKEALTLLKISI